MVGVGPGIIEPSFNFEKKCCIIRFTPKVRMFINKRFCLR
jgi:hypothetical protein